MTARAPLFAGVTGGAGTTTLATALHGIDGGRYDGRPVDVLVCRADGASLARAAATTGAPVLAVRADGALTPAARAWIDRLRSRFAAIVVLPGVDRWRELDDPRPEAARLLAVPAHRQPPALRRYADALLEITAALLDGGTLTGSGRAPQSPVRRPPRPSPIDAPRRVGRANGPVPLPGDRPVASPPRVLWRGLAPVQRAPRPTPPGAGGRTDLDDDALEAREPVRSR